MALSPDELDQVARGTVDLYRAAEEAILTQVTRRLAAGQDATDWQAQRLGQLSSLRRSVQRILDATDAEGGPRIRQAVGDAWRTGTGRATAGLPARLLPGDPDTAAAALARPAVRVDAVESLAGELVSDIGSRHRNVLRHVEDVYRGTIQQAAAVSVAGGQTRLQAAQHAYRQFVDQGVTGFTDVSGRHWRLSSYVEMATRTVTQRAAVQGQTDRLQDLGLDLVIISDSPRECERCRPFEGAVLSASGRTPTGRIEMEHAAEDRTVEVTVDGTLDEARRAGLFHPNCTHSARGYLPGVTRRQPAQANPEGDVAQQRQREIERNIRRYKERERGALDPAAAASARGKTRAWQRQMRDHLDDNPELKRLRYRERIGAGNLPPTAAGIADAPPPRPTLTAAVSPPTPSPFDELVDQVATGEAARRAASLSLMRPRRGFTTAAEREQTGALRDYKSQAYNQINPALRRERGAGDQLRSTYPQIDHIDQALAPLAEDVVVHRAITRPQAMFGDAADRSLTGGRWTEHAYMSTTTDVATAERLAADRMIMRILVPRGTPAAELSDDQYEAELLLDRGLQLRIVSDTGPGSSPRRIDAEIIP